MPRVWCIALRPLYASRNLRRAVVVDKAPPCRPLATPPRRCIAEGGRRRVRCGRLAGLRVAAGDVGQQLRRPRRHRTHGDGRDRKRQRRAVDWSVLPEPRGISGEVPAGCHPALRSAVRDVRFGTIRAVASPLLYRGGCVKRGALLQRLRALPRQEGGRDWLREALRAPALRVRVVRVLPAVFQGRPW